MQFVNGGVPFQASLGLPWLREDTIVCLRAVSLAAAATDVGSDIYPDVDPHETLFQTDLVEPTS